MKPLPEYLAIVSGPDGFFIQGTFRRLEENRIRSRVTEYWQDKPVPRWICAEMRHLAKRFASHAHAASYIEANERNLDPDVNESVAYR